MTDADVPAFAELLATLGATFGVEVDKPMSQGYWLGLEDLSVRDVQNAVARGIRTCKFMPKPAELRELAGAEVVATRAVRAWSAVKGAIRAHGAYASVDFDDPVVNATVRNLGGWRRLCSLTSEELDKWTRQEFTKAFLALAMSGVSADEGKYLPGIHEEENRFNGHAPEKPRLVAVAGGERRRLGAKEGD